VEPRSLNVPLQRRTRVWPLALVAVAVTLAVLTALAPGFAVAYASSALLAGPVLVPYLASSKQALGGTHTWRGIAATGAVLAYLAMARNVLVPLLTAWIQTAWS